MSRSANRRRVRISLFRWKGAMLPAALGLLVASTALARDPDTVPGSPRWPGMKIGERIQLPNQWSLQPAGEQIELGDFPVNIALHPKEPYAAVLHCGYGKHEIAIVDLKYNIVASRAQAAEMFYGLAFDPTGSRLFASGGE